MKLLTWNVAHQTNAGQNKNAQPLMAAALNFLAPDVIVLTEYAHGLPRQPFIDELTELGWKHQLMTQKTPKENQVFIASRSKLESGSIIGPSLHKALPSNLLHVHLPDDGLDILGVRLVNYNTVAERNTVWDWLIETAETVVNKPYVMLGDFNVDVDRSGTEKHLIGRLLNQGWQHALPPAGMSHFNKNKGKPSRHDHAFVSRHFEVRSAEYVSKRDPYMFSGHGSGVLSDHAPLLIEIENVQEPSG